MPRAYVRGATLLEVVVVLGILGVVFAFTWSAAGSLARRLALRAAGTVLVSELRAAQARAIAEHRSGRSHGIAFAVGADRYTVIVREGSRRTPGRVVRLPSGVRTTYARFGGGSPQTAMFSASSLFGAPSGAGTVTLQAGGSRLCVRVVPATGRIRVANTGCP
ncbi:MAG: prepilin-type N-terminal cleavage/methylation domain-containing protein [bacterium]